MVSNVQTACVVSETKTLYLMLGNRQNQVTITLRLRSILILALELLKAAIIHITQGCYTQGEICTYNVQLSLSRLKELFLILVKQEVMQSLLTSSMGSVEPLFYKLHSSSSLYMKPSHGLYSVCSCTCYRCVYILTIVTCLKTKHFHITTEI